MDNIFIRVLRRLLKKKDKEEIDLISKENNNSLEYSKSKIENYSNIEKILSDVEFTSWSLAKSSIRYFFTYLLENNSNKDKINILELGSGSSTLFFEKMSDLYDINFISLEHDNKWFNKLSKIIKKSKINKFELKKLSDLEFESLFNNTEAINKFEKIGELCNKEDYYNTRLKNAFYNINNEFNSNLSNLSGLILDGPHGNGRGLAFPLFYNFINQGTIILIDDYTHYPFLNYLEKLFEFDILEISITKNKKWIILKIKNKLHK